MSCLPVPRCLKRLGRYLSKMFSNKDWVDWKRLNEEDKENVPIDFETSAHFCSNSTQQSTITDDSMSSWRRTFIETPNKTYAKSTYLNGFSNGSSTSGYESTSPVKQSSESISLEFQIYNDVFGSSFPSLLSQIPSFNYSPMSNFSDNSAMTSSDFFARDFNTTPRSNHDQEYENLRHDFEMNGLTVDTTDLDFLPSNSSTPKPIRRDTPMPNRGYQQELPQQQQQTPMIPPQWMTNFSSMNNRKPQSRKFKPHKNSLQDHCVFCKNNGQDEKIYRTHTVKDAKGRVLCPVLRLYRCPICGADGDKAHTTKYCPKKPIITPEDLIPMKSRSNRCGFSHRKVF